MPLFRRNKSEKKIASEYNLDVNPLAGNLNEEFSDLTSVNFGNFNRGVIQNPLFEESHSNSSLRNSQRKKTLKKNPNLATGLLSLQKQNPEEGYLDVSASVSPSPSPRASLKSLNPLASEGSSSQYGFSNLSNTGNPTYVTRADMSSPSNQQLYAQNPANVNKDNIYTLSHAQANRFSKMLAEHEKNQEYLTPNKHEPSETFYSLVPRVESRSGSMKSLHMYHDIPEIPETHMDYLIQFKFLIKESLFTKHDIKHLDKIKEEVEARLGRGNKDNIDTIQNIIDNIIGGCHSDNLENWINTCDNNKFNMFLYINLWLKHKIVIILEKLLDDNKIQLDINIYIQLLKFIKTYDLTKLHTQIDDSNYNSIIRTVIISIKDKNNFNVMHDMVSKIGKLEECDKALQVFVENPFLFLSNNTKSYNYELISSLNFEGKNIKFNNDSHHKFYVYDKNSLFFNQYNNLKSFYHKLSSIIKKCNNFEETKINEFLKDKDILDFINNINIYDIACMINILLPVDINNVSDGIMFFNNQYGSLNLNYDLFNPEKKIKQTTYLQIYDITPSFATKALKRATKIFKGGSRKLRHNTRKLHHNTRQTRKHRNIHNRQRIHRKRTATSSRA